MTQPGSVGMLFLDEGDLNMVVATGDPQLRHHVCTVRARANNWHKLFLIGRHLEGFASSSTLCVSSVGLLSKQELRCIGFSENVETGLFQVGGSVATTKPSHFSERKPCRAQPGASAEIIFSFTSALIEVVDHRTKSSQDD